jgi:hypothetical protein
MKPEVITAIKVSRADFWVVIPYGLAVENQHFRGTYCLQLQGGMTVQHVAS